jgi:maleylpyruvate isomerase
VEDIELLVEEVEAATSRLVASARALVESKIAEPSALPGWSRGNLLCHLARNADGLRALLLSARSRQPLRMYASPTTRVADIEAGATRPPDVITADLIEASRRFVAEARAMPAAVWSSDVAFTSGGDASPPVVKASDIALMRLQEIELHHVDLDVGYAIDSIPTPVAERLLRRVARQRDRQALNVCVTANDAGWVGGTSFAEARTFVEGTAHALLGWLSGRADGSDLEASPTLPTLPPLG